MNTEKLIELLTKAINYNYPTDPTKPGIHIAHVGDKGYYVAVHRYKGSFGKEKFVEVSDYDVSLSNALTKVSNKVVIKTEAPVNPLDLLKNFLTNKLF